MAQVIFNSDAHKVLYSGIETSTKNGVAIITNKSVGDTMLGYNPVSDRIISLRLQAQPVNITIIQIYAPTSAATDEAKTSFYRELQETLDNTPNKDVVYIMGDWNAKVGRTESSSAVGKFSLGERNEEGERMVDFCEQNELVVTNTLFDQPKRRLYIWTSPKWNLS